jgi:uncharacterized membrane protein HdeD (DUF308 family)
MKKTLHDARFALLISGISSLVFGIITLAVPTIPLLFLVELFSGYIIIKGFTISIGALQTKKEERHWLFLLGYGIQNIIVGIITLVFPVPTLFILGFIVSINLLICGILQIMIAYHLRKEVKGIGWLVFSGIVAITAGAYIYIIPRISAPIILDLIAIAGLLLGIFLVSLSLKAGGWHNGMKEPRIQMQ